MKKIIYNLLSVLLVVITLTSCVKDTDYDTPQIDCEEPQIDANSIISIELVINKWLVDNPDGISTNLVYFEGENAEPVYVEGYITSSDNTGNFYKELFIQNNPTNPTHAVKVAVGVSDLYTKYDVGRKIFIKLNGLVINKVHGEIVIGKENNSEVDEISEITAKTQILRNCEPVEITPKIITSPLELTQDHLGMFVKFENLQFSDDLLNENFVSVEDSFDTHRGMLNCSDGSYIRLETSTYADFKDVILPFGKGTISGIVSRDYSDDFYVIKINSLEDIDFSEERCDGVELAPTMTLSELANGNMGELGINDDVIEGYVISNDAPGNFYKTIYIQDSVENPTVGIQILTDEYDLFTRYPVGSKVYLRLNTLYIGYSYGVLSIGYVDGGYPSQITNGALGSYLINSGEEYEIIPSDAILDSSGTVTRNALDNQGNPIPDPGSPTGFEQEDVPMCTLVTINSLQLTYDELGSAYAYYNGNESVNRTLENCEMNSQIIMRNSGYANFANVPFPSGNGTVTAVLSQYFDTNQIYIRDTSDVNLTEERKCEFVCGTTQSDGTNVLFEDDFSSYSEYETIDNNGWTNYMQEGTEQWEAYDDDDSGSRAAHLNPYNNGSNEIVSWLITPPINMNNQTGEVLSFMTSNSYSDDSTLTVLISNDWTGNNNEIEEATWYTIPEASIVNDDEYYQNWVHSNYVDISCMTGDNVYVAFKYEGDGGGGSSTNNGTYELDDVKITSD